MIVKFGSCVALSIVACGMLCGAQTYTDWNQTNFKDGDKVDITHNATQAGSILNSDIKLTSGTLTANINAGLLKVGTLNGAMVGNFNGSSITFGSAGATIKFNITKAQNAFGADEAFKLNGTTFTADAGLEIKNTIAGGGFTVFNATNGSMTFNGDLTISGASTAFSTSGTTLSINQNGGKKVDITGAINATGGTTNIKLDDGDNIKGEFRGTNGSKLTLDINNSTYTGDITNNGETKIDIKNNGKLDGKLETSGTSLTLSMDKGAITQSVTSNVSGKNSITLQDGSTINGDVSLTTTSTQQGANTLDVKSGTIKNVTLKAGNSADSNKITMNNSSKIQKVTTQGDGGLSFLLQGTSSVTEGIHTSATSTKVDIAATGSSKINGTSELAGANEVLVVFKDSAGAGTLNFKGKTENNLVARPNGGGQTNSNINTVTMQNQNTNQVLTENSASLTIGSLSMDGKNNNIAQTNNGGTNLAHNGANLTVNGNATIKTNGGKNQLALGKGNITGQLQTQGNTNLYTLNDYHIQGGVHHTVSGNFNADLYGNSQISQGIQTSGTGNATVNLKANSKINGNSTFATQTNKVTLETSSQINGNTTFAGTTGTLDAGDNSQIKGQVVTDKGTANYTFKTSSILEGGIDTHNGAGKTTANFSDNSKLQNGTSDFRANTDITFANSSKAINEKFNVNAGTTNITFKDQAQMEGGKITTNNGGTSNIKFENQSKMNNGEISTTGGNFKSNSFE